MDLKKALSGKYRFAALLVVLFSSLAFSFSTVFSPGEHVLHSFQICLLLALVFLLFNYYWDKKYFRSEQFPDLSFNIALRHLALSVLIYTLVTGLFFYFFFHKNVFINRFFYLTGIPLCIVFSIISYSSLYAFHLRRLFKTRNAPAIPPQDTYIVKLGSNTVQVRIEDIKYIRSADKISRLFTWQNKDYIIDHSISEMEAICGTTQFFRANRQCLVSRRSVHKFRSIENSKVLLTLTDGEELQLSRYKAPEFRAWIRNLPLGDEIPTIQKK